MKAERLFQILGLVDESLIEEAVSASSPPAGTRGAARGRGFAAAGRLPGSIAGDAALAGGESGGDGHSPGTTYLSYAGPVFPLTTA